MLDNSNRVLYGSEGCRLGTMNLLLYTFIRVSDDSFQTLILTDPPSAKGLN